jgi:Skp family chaperone for outer membrane proteins
MNHIKRIAKTATLIVFMMGFGGMSFAQQCKVALVNMQEAITGSNEGKAASAKLDIRVKEWKVKLDVSQEAILEAQRSKEQGSDQVAAILRKKMELELITQQAQKDVDDYRELLLAPITKSANEIAKQVAAERGIDSVMDSSSPTASFPINADATNCDITSEVMKRMNAKFSPADPAK